MPVSIVFKKSIVPVGISIPYLNDFSDQTDQELFSDPMWGVVSEVPYFDVDATSYYGLWTGGLIFDSVNDSIVKSNFYLRGDFTDLQIQSSSVGGSYNSTRSHGMFLAVVDDVELMADVNNAVRIWWGLNSGGYHTNTDNCKSGSWNYTATSDPIHYEATMKISRSGNTFYMYSEGSLVATETIPNMPPDARIFIRAEAWENNPSQNYLLESISIEDATVTYKEVLDNFDSGTNGQEPDSNLWSISGDSPANSATYNNGKLRLDVTGTNLYVLFNESLSGDFAVKVDFDLVAAPSSSWWVAAMMANTQNGDGVRIDRLANPTQNIRRAYREDGGGWQYSSNTADSTTTGQYMITREGSTLKSWYNVGDGFVPYTAPITCDSTDMDITLFLQTNTGISATVDFDNFVVIR